MDPSPSPNPLTGLRNQIREHWQEHRPQMYRDLKERGQLDRAVERAFRLTADAFHDLLVQKVPVNQAWELVRENWALLPPSQSPSLPFKLPAQPKNEK